MESADKGKRRRKREGRRNLGQNVFSSSFPSPLFFLEVGQFALDCYDFPRQEESGGEIETKKKLGV